MEFEPALSNWVYACVGRLTDRYEWREMFCVGELSEERKKVEDALIAAIMADPAKADAFVDVCIERGIVEESYFED
jgi:hypothetical protein